MIDHSTHLILVSRSSFIIATVSSSSSVISVCVCVCVGRGVCVLGGVFVCWEGCLCVCVCVALPHLYQMMVVPL